MEGGVRGSARLGAVIQSVAQEEEEVEEAPADFNPHSGAVFYNSTQQEEEEGDHHK